MTSGGSWLPLASGEGNPLFEAGAMLLDRYRIVGRLGRGGMGEVYRADDLTLRQPVALKFLSVRPGSDLAQLARFRKEVRLARQVSHPNVCRVYDIGETDGCHFISMEFIDGENLSSLLRRIGRLSLDKALEISHQMCAGLAAAHRQGVLHRDLKPTNIMLDGRGMVRITDFGLAALRGEVRGVEARSGTPPYMSPEQLRGGVIDEKSDVFSLGLVLYEVFTGRRLLEARSLPELTQLHRLLGEDSSRLLDRAGLDRDVESTILRCLQAEPAKRPSVLAVAAALPGGDPLSAVLNAGDTPSPELVASIGESGLLPARRAMALIAAIGLGIVLLAWFGRSNLISHTPMRRSPELLADRAAGILKLAGYSESAEDSAYGFSWDRDYIGHLNQNAPADGRWEQLSHGLPTAFYFWYLQSEARLNPAQLESGPGRPALAPGMIRIRLGSSGELRDFEAIPLGESTAAPDDLPRFDWEDLLGRAGLDRTNTVPSKSTWTPARYVDERRSWSGGYQGRENSDLRIEAGALGGRLVYFHIFQPWDRPARPDQDQRTLSGTLSSLLRFLLLSALAVGSLVQTRRNLRLGRGDRQGAIRLAAWIFASNLIARQLLVHDFWSLDSHLSSLMTSLSEVLLISSLVWLLYISLEPYLRRRWPQGIISWTRLLAGRWRDPLVGRDVLIGVAFGVLIAALTKVEFWASRLTDGPVPLPPALDFQTLLGARQSLAVLLGFQSFAILSGLGFFFLLMLTRLAVKRDWLALLVVAIPLFLQNLLFLQDESQALTFAFITVPLAWLLGVFLVLRYGLVAGISGILVSRMFQYFPTGLDLDAWHSTPSLFGFAVCIALASFGFWVSVERRRFPRAIGQIG